MNKNPPQGDQFNILLNKVTLPFTRKITYQLGKTKQELMERMAEMENELKKAIEQYYQKQDHDRL